MFSLCFMVLLLLVVRAEFVVQNGTCPDVVPRELDLKGIDGKWYLAAAATDLEIEGECATVMFSHKNSNTTDLSISWVNNNTVMYYNGSVSLTVDPNNNVTGDLLVVTYTDQKTEKYSFLDINYEHYAVVFACYDNSTGNSSTYELWKLSRTPHIKDDSAAKIDKVLAEYSLQDTTFVIFNNTDSLCQTNGGYYPNPSSLIMTSAAAILLFRKLYGTTCSY